MDVGDGGLPVQDGVHDAGVRYHEPEHVLHSALCAQGDGPTCSIFLVAYAIGHGISCKYLVWTWPP